MSFTLFPRLPVELRLEIWREALPGPRTVTISASNGRRANLIVGAPEESMLNSLYYTCKDSWNTVTVNYQRQFHDELNDRPIWFSNDIDTLCFTSICTVNFFCNVRNHVKFMSFGWPLDVFRRNVEPAEVPDDLTIFVIHAIMSFPDLERFTYFTEGDVEVGKALIPEFMMFGGVPSHWAPYKEKFEKAHVGDLDFELVRVPTPSELA